MKMDSAYINIKFTPLITSIDNCESRYNLEIVPIASCVENIEKLEWKDAKDKIEYTVPIVYKIIIMKQNYPKNRIKVYHSCFDIISSSSATNIKLRPTSEYSGLNKPNETLNANTATFDILLNPKFKIKNDINLYLCENNNPLKSLKVLKSAVTLLTNGNFETDNKVINIKSPEVMNPINRIIKTDNRGRNADQILINKTSPFDTSESGDDMISHINEIKKKKMAAPIYNTMGDRPHLSKNTNSHYTDQLLLNNLDNYFINNGHQNQISNLNLFSSKSSVAGARILPEIRVANFVQNMQREILPLKIILNDIINKCISLNFYTLLRNISTCDKNIASDTNIKGCDVKNCLKSNRVVYSVVFNE